jgi:hypothetical protein
MHAGPVFRSCGSNQYIDGIHPYTAAGQAYLARAIQQALALQPPTRSSARLFPFRDFILAYIYSLKNLVFFRLVVALFRPSTSGSLI